MASKMKQAVEMTKDLVKKRKAEAVGFGGPASTPDEDIKITINGVTSTLPPGYEIVIRKVK